MNWAMGCGVVVVLCPEVVTEGQQRRNVNGSNGNSIVYRSGFANNEF